MNRRISNTVPHEKNLEQTLEKLGGEEVIRRKYPELYKAVVNTRERVKTMPLCNSDENGDYIFGTEDSCKIRTLNYLPDTTLSSTSSMEMKTPKPSLAIIGDVTDTDTGRSIDGFAVSEDNSDTLSANSTTGSSDISPGKAKRFIAKSSFVVIEKDANGQNIVRTLNSEMDSQKTFDGVPVVKEIIVNAPLPVNHKGADHTVIYYNRSGSNADYQYQNVKYNENKIDVYMPFSGSVEFISDWEPVPNAPIILDGDEKLTLEIKKEHNGIAKFNMEHKGKIKWNVTGSVLSWEFPDDWHNVLDKDNLNCANNMSFYCKMYINTVKGLPVPIVIQSGTEKHDDPSFKNIPYINILWGCFAKDVLIKMKNGNFLPIEQIKAGDKVMTKDGIRTVTEVVTGTEEKLIHIKTASVKRIQVSREHPMLTTEGMVTAEKLTAGTILITENGHESIESLYFVHYNDAAYNLRLDQDGILIANNFYAGDFAAQNSVKQPVKAPIPQKPEEIQEEFADLIHSINQVKKNSL